MKTGNIFSTLLLAGSAVAAPTELVSRAPGFPWGEETLRGVNIGGWLVLEPWITPSIFEQWPVSQGIVDEWSLTKQLGQQQASAILKKHWDSWATFNDFKKIADAGFNHVRIPIGFWAYETYSSPYVKGAAPYMDAAIDWARATGLKVIIDLHGAPRSQNGFDNSGHKIANPNWTKGNSIARTLKVLNTISKKYAQPKYNDVVMGIELLNEPAGYELDMGLIKSFFKKGYKQVRKISKRPVVIHDAFQEPSSYNGFLSPDNAANVAIDHHYYQVFTPEENALSATQHIKKVCKDVETMTGADKWTFVGEFSGAMTDCATYLNGYGVGSRYEGTYPDSTRVGSCEGQNDLSTWSQDMKDSTRKFLAAQIGAFESKLNGWTFWNFKTERSPSWDALQLVDAGLFPALDGSEGGICA